MHDPTTGHQGKYQLIKILLVEDNENDYVIVRDLLHDIQKTLSRTKRFPEIQYELHRVSTYEAGLEALQSQPLDVALVDYKLGQRSGLELLQAAQKQDFYGPSHHTTFILITGLEDPDLDVAAIEAGAVEYLYKDQLSAPLLEHVIRSAIARGKVEVARRLAAEQNILLGTAVNNISGGVLVTDPHQEDNPIIFANPAFYEMTGYSSEEVLGRNCRFLQGPQTDPSTIQQMRQAIQAQQPFSGLILNYRKDGTPFWNRLKINPVFDSSGHLLNFVGLQSDVTARHTAKEELRQSEERFQILSRATNDVVWDWNLLTDDVWWNQEFQTHFGYRKEQIETTSTSWVSRVHPDDLKQVQETIYQAIEVGQQMWSHEYRFQRADGSYAYIYDRGYLLFNEQGQPTRMIGSMQDITSRREVENQLREREEFQRTLLDNFPNGTVNVVDRQFNCLLIAGSGLAAADMTTEQLKGQSLDEIFEPEQAATLKVHYQQALDGEKVNFEFSHQDLVYAVSAAPWPDPQGEISRVIAVAQDITERKQAEQALEAKTQEIITNWDSMSDAFFSVDTQWCFTHINSQAVQLWQRSPEELIGQNIWEAFPAAVNSNFYKEYHRAMEQQVAVSFEELYAPQNVWREVHAYPSSAGLSVYFRDITQRKQAEAQLLFQKSLLQAQAETSLDGILVISEAGEVLSYNQHFLEIWGMSLDTRVDNRQALLEIVNAQVVNPQQFLEKVQYLYQQRDQHSQDEIILQNGRILDRYSSPVTSPDGTYYGRVWYFRDITERKQAEEERDRFFTLSLDLLAIADSKGYFKRLNPAFEQLLGYSPEELMTKPFLEWVHPDDREATLAVMADLTEGVPTLQFVNRYRCQDGSYRWFSWRTVPYGDVYYAAAHDITALKRAEAALHKANDELELRVMERTAELNLSHQAMSQAKQEADKANRAKTEFLSRMSHELRTPLNAILGFAQLMELRAKDTRDKQAVEQILKGGQHLLHLINEVLDISRIESGLLTMSIEPVELLPLMHDALDLVTPLASDNHVHLQYADEVTCVHLVLADQQRLKQVLINLLSNAIKYNRRGGTVSIQCSFLDKDRLRVEVRDDGPGIAVTNLEKIFVPFERLGAEKSSVEGTGLGLPLCKGMMEAMGGSIGLDSEVGVGTTAWIELPVVTSPTVSELESSTSKTLSTEQEVTHQILLIEDNLVNHKLIEQILEDQPHIQLVAAMQGTVGLELAQQHPDLILLDLHLPDIMGHEVLQRLKEDVRTADIPVVIVSADATPSQMERLKEAGAVAYLIKPLNIVEFLQTVHDVLNSRKNLTSIQQ